MSKRPTVAVIDLETVIQILTVINANTRVAHSRDSAAIAKMRDALVVDGVIAQDAWGDCTFSDFYAERGDNE
jgi:hypothetical protein